MKTRFPLLLLLLALVAAACGDAGTTTTTSEPVSTTAAPGTTAPPDTAPSTTRPPETTTTAPPESTTSAPPVTEVGGRMFEGADGVQVEITDTSRIVSLAGDITETLFELGVGENVVAVDVTTTHPPEAADIPVIGFAQQLAPEPVIGLQPTLVLADELTAPPEAIEQIRGAGIPVVVLPTQNTLDGALDKITAIAEIVDKPEAGQALADKVSADIQAAVAMAAEQAPDEARRVAFVYSRGPQVLLLFGAGMATQAMIEGAGAVDAGVDSGIRGPAPLTPEALVAAAPDVIVLPEAGVGALGGVEAFAATPGVAETPAGQNGDFLVYDEAYFFNLGPRVGLALQEFVGDLYGS